MYFVISSLFSLFVFLLAPLPALAEKRVALVIGNSSYAAIPRLDNPVNDATLVANTLQSLGFSLIGGGAQLDLDKASLERKVQQFGAELTNASVALFYYAGHGVQVKGANYLADYPGTYGHLMSEYGLGLVPTATQASRTSMSCRRDRRLKRYWNSAR